MALSLCSFGRSFLCPVLCRPRSVRRVVRAFLAARRRWPDGRLVVGLRSVEWVTPGGFCGLLLSGFGPREWIVVDWFFAHRLAWLAWCLFPSVRRGWDF